MNKLTKSTLNNLVWNSLIVSSLIASLTFSSCHKPDDDPIPPVKNYPSVTFNVANPSGDSPLPVHMKVSSVNTDIASYRLYLDGVVDSSSSPIDTTITFYPGTHSVYADVVNTKRLSSSRSPIATITANLVDDDLWWTLCPFPKGKVNLFTYPDSTAEYNAKKTLSARNDYIHISATNDICKRIPVGVRNINGKDYGFLCAPASGLFEYNSNDWNDLYDGGVKKYDGYIGEDIDSIYFHHGTGKFRGSHKAPVYTVIVSSEHGQNYAVTGNDLSAKSLNLIEAPKGLTNLQPGQEGVPLDFSDFLLYYAYMYIDKSGHNSYANIPIAKYSLENGILNFVSVNPNVDLIMTRDTLPVGVNVRSPVDGKTYAANSKILLDEVVTSGTNVISRQSFRYAYYSLNGGPKIAMGLKDKMDLIYQGKRYFPAGNYTLSLYAKNEFFMDANKNITFTVK